MISPTWMTIINAIATIGLGLEGTGVTNLLPPQYGMIFAAVIAAANTIAHATTPPVAGPLVKTGV
jgi:hypothetical protein